MYNMAIELINEVDFTPLDKYVVTFATEDSRTFKQTQSVVDKKLSTDDETVTKMVKKDVKYNHQVATVVATPPDDQVVKSETRVSTGDKVLVDFRACMPLDGYENLYLIPRYNILGLICE
jgi:hypothetical protein